VPSSPLWQYDAEAHRYREVSTGRFLSPDQQRALRDQFIDRQQVKAKDLAAQLSRGDLTLPEWERAMRGHVKGVFLDQAMLGRGGRNAMTPADFGRVGSAVKRQYQYLSAFSQEIAGGDLSAEAIAARAALYTASATQAYERGRASAYGLTLPQYPGDGSQDCRANCRCAWEIEEDETEWRATWSLGGKDPCEGCRENAGKWNPLSVSKTQRANLNGKKSVPCVH
jgi:hypothetical protein